MKIQSVKANRRRRCFEVSTSHADYSFPFAMADPAPTPADRLEGVFIDEELGGEGFTWVLESGREGSLHVDSVREYNRDPDHLAELLLYDLTVLALDLIKESGLGKREMIRRLDTSPAQLYRLLDPANSRKSIRQMLALLHLLGYEARMVLEPSGKAEPRRRVTIRRR